jgi:trypsin
LLILKTFAHFFIFHWLFSCREGLPALYDNERNSKDGLAVAGQFPYVVSITENDRHFCGGFIYSARWIITTASCVAG